MRRREGRGGAREMEKAMEGETKRNRERNINRENRKGKWKKQ